jgi:hypothetical protein
VNHDLGLLLLEWIAVVFTAGACATVLVLLVVMVVRVIRDER